MKRIASRDNALFKSLKALVGDAASRRDEGIAVLEGVHLCEAWLASGGIPKRIVVGSSALTDGEVTALLGHPNAKDPSIERFELDDALFAALSQLAQGVHLLMLVDIPKPAAPECLVETSVLLDRIQDPGNVGSILRSAAAAGVRDVHLSAGCAGAWSPKVLRAGMGAHFHLRLFEDRDLVALRSTAAIPWLATSPHAGRPIHEADLRGPVAWAFGHEGQGLDPALIDASTAVRIPQPGQGESLNVAAAAAVCFFEQVRQRDADR